MHNRLLLGTSLALAATLGSSACTTWVTSLPATKITADGSNPEQNGLRYFLPIPVLIVTPQPDGTVKVETDYMPDPRHEYVVYAGSFMSTHKLEVKTDDKGFLTDVTMNQSSAAVAQELAKQSGDVAKSALDDLKAKRIAEETRMTNLEGDIQKTQIEFDQSTAKIEFYKHKLENEPGSSVWQSKLDEEEVNRIALNEKLKNLKNQRKALDSSGFNTAGNDGVFAKAWGPMIFRVEQIADQTGVIDAATGKEIPDRVPSVRLFALFDQQAFATNSVASAASGGGGFHPKASRRRSNPAFRRTKQDNRLRAAGQVDRQFQT